MIDLFDKVFFLKVSLENQNEMLMHESRENPMGNTEFQRKNAVKWAQEIEEKAKSLNIPFVDASLSPSEIYSILKRG